VVGRAVRIGGASVLVLGAAFAASRVLPPPPSAPALQLATAEQPRYFPEPPQVEYPEWDYDGRFTFARIKFDPTFWGFSNAYTWGLDLKWNHDYPEAEINFMKILDDITGLSPRMEGGNILEISDPRLFEHPWAYLCEPGFWNPTDEEVAILRSYLLKGGFLVIDDFFMDYRSGQPRHQWDNFERQIERLFPGVILYPLDETHPSLRVFFELDDVDFTDREDPNFAAFDPVIYGVFEDNDPQKRLMVAVNWNLDIGDYWEWSDTGLYPLNLTEKGFKLGVNYLMYGLVR
jgi:hypothetical protein